MFNYLEFEDYGGPLSELKRVLSPDVYAGWMGGTPLCRTLEIKFITLSLVMLARRDV